MIFVSLFKGRGKLIKLLEVKCETERTTVQVRYMRAGELGPRVVNSAPDKVNWLNKIGFFLLLAFYCNNN